MAVGQPFLCVKAYVLGDSRVLLDYCTVPAQVFLGVSTSFGPGSIKVDLCLIYLVVFYGLLETAASVFVTLHLLTVHSSAAP
jgi:hypothetical protein